MYSLDSGNYDPDRLGDPDYVKQEFTEPLEEYTTKEKFDIWTLDNREQWEKLCEIIAPYLIENFPVSGEIEKLLEEHEGWLMSSEAAGLRKIALLLQIAPHSGAISFQPCERPA